MSDFNNGYPGALPAPADMAVDQGLRAFMTGVYNKLALGLLVSGLIAFGMASSPEIMTQMYQIEGGRVVGYAPLGYGVAFAPLGLILLSMAFMRNPSPAGANILYWLIVATVGASMAVLLLIYTGPSIAFTLVVTALAFGGLSMFGYVTKRNLGPVGNFMVMAMWGLIIGSVAAFMIPGLQNPMLFLAMNAIGVVLSAGLIAFITQETKFSYYATQGHQDAQKVASTMAALNLFIQFVNLFRFLLAFIGMRR